MKNKDIITSFLNGKSAKTKNVKTDGSTLYSYNTAIATHYPIGIIVNNTKYSSSTSRIQSNLKAQIKAYGVNIVNVDNLGFNLRRNDLIEATNQCFN